MEQMSFDERLGKASYKLEGMYWIIPAAIAIGIDLYNQTYGSIAIIAIFLLRVSQIYIQTELSVSDIFRMFIKFPNVNKLSKILRAVFILHYPVVLYLYHWTDILEPVGIVPSIGTGFIIMYVLLWQWADHETEKTVSTDAPDPEQVSSADPHSETFGRQQKLHSVMTDGEFFEDISEEELSQLRSILKRAASGSQTKARALRPEEIDLLQEYEVKDLYWWLLEEREN